MRNVFYRTMGSVVLCCMALGEAFAGLNSSTYMGYDTYTGQMYAVALLSPDYNDFAIYDMNIEMDFLVDNGDGTHSSVYCRTLDSCSPFTEAWMPYDPGAEYTVLAYNRVVPVVEEGGSLVDYYNYYAYDKGFEPDYYSLQYGFLGSGPPQYGIGNVLVGIVYAIASGGIMHGGPDHLKLLDDKIQEATSNNCGQIERRLKWQIVDEAGKSAGAFAVGEEFPGTIINPCSGSAVASTSGYYVSGGKYYGNYTNKDGKFKSDDIVRIGCPAPSDGCGFKLDPDRWYLYEAPRFVSKKLLASVVIDAKKRQITVAGKDTAWKKNTEFFPDGHTQEP